MKRGVVCLLVLLTGGCDQISRLRHAILPQAPYDVYVRSLRQAGIHATSLGAEWMAAGERALAAPRPGALPRRDTESIHADQPSAVAYQFELQRGRVYVLELEGRLGNRANVFADLFHVPPGREPQRVAGIGPPEQRLEFEPLENGTFVLRMQAEFLATGTSASTQKHRHALLFPVVGRGRANVHSFFGAARGGRDHQGIDIFAPRGTPVVAATDGWISSTTPNKLGGNVVWLWDARRDQSLYYAHLDKHAVSRGDRVAKGDVLGFVGNTGNARTTAPHLHFGIYRRGRGAIDPLYYVVDPAS